MSKLTISRYCPFKRRSPWRRGRQWCREQWRVPCEWSRRWREHAASVLTDSAAQPSKKYNRFYVLWHNSIASSYTSTGRVAWYSVFRIRIQLGPDTGSINCPPKEGKIEEILCLKSSNVLCTGFRKTCMIVFLVFHPKNFSNFNCLKFCHYGSGSGFDSDLATAGSRIRQNTCIRIRIQWIRIRNTDSIKRIYQ